MQDIQGKCSKLSYKLKFNHVDTEQTFFGLKQLQMHAALGDARCPTLPLATSPPQHSPTPAQLTLASNRM
jgi:hypothetical protein